MNTIHEIATAAMTVLAMMMVFCAWIVSARVAVFAWGEYRKPTGSSIDLAAMLTAGLMFVFMAFAFVAVVTDPQIAHGGAKSARQLAPGGGE